MCGVCALRDQKSGLERYVPGTFAMDRDMGFVTTYQAKHRKAPSLEAIRAHDAQRKNRDPLVLMSWIVNSGTGRMPHVSLAKNTKCGGYAGLDRYLFEAEITGMEVREWSHAVGVTRRPNAQWPTLWMDAAKLEHATMIAVEQAQAAQEITFFTPIPRDLIRVIREPSGKESGETLPRKVALYAQPSVKKAPSSSIASRYLAKLKGGPAPASARVWRRRFPNALTSAGCASRAPAGRPSPRPERSPGTSAPAARISRAERAASGAGAHRARKARRARREGRRISRSGRSGRCASPSSRPSRSP
jgi:hypothetical protein